MELHQCRTIVLASRRKDSGMISIKLLQCNRRDCQYCQKLRARKYYKSMSTPYPMELYYNEVSDEAAKRIKYVSQKNGDFYWRCPQPNGKCIVICTNNKHLKGKEFRTSDEAESVNMMTKWLSDQPHDTKVSSTRPVKKSKTKYEWDTYWVSGVNLSSIKKYMSAGNWDEKRGGIYTPQNDSVDWDVITKFLEAGGHFVNPPKKKVPQYLLSTMLIVDSTEKSE